jgi:hypothetical protein
MLRQPEQTDIARRLGRPDSPQENIPADPNNATSAPAGFVLWLAALEITQSAQGPKGNGGGKDSGR